MRPTFSILVPTRQRPDTLEHTLASLLVQKGDDYEIVVADNCGDAAVQTVIAKAQALTSKLRHVRSDQILPMAENWERGMSATSGGYVTVLGDDDALLPSTLARFRALLAQAPAVKVVSWDCHTYWWPDTIAYWNANRLFVNLSRAKANERSSTELLNFFYRGGDFGSLPMIYNALVSRDVIVRARAKYGRYFAPADMSPDVTSGIINCLFTERYLHSFNPLSIRGNSKRSVGTSTWVRALGSELRDEYFKTEGKTLEELTHSTIIASPNLLIAIANTKLRCKDFFFPSRNDLQVDLNDVVKQVIADLNREPEAYEANLADALRLAERLGKPVNPAAIPAKTPINRTKFQGPFSNGPNDLWIAVNCDTVGTSNVAEAARLAEALSPTPPELAG